MSKKYRKVRRVAFWISIFVVLLLAASAGYAAYIANTAKNIVDNSQQRLEKSSDLRKKTVDPRIDNISILFLGVDTGDGEDVDYARSDAMILATFNKEDKSIKMVSIPRDSRVELIGSDRMDKITHAHAFGGIDMAVSTVESLLNVPVDYYVRLNFDAFVEVVDTLGGLKIDVPFDIVEQDSQRRKGQINIKKGLQTLNGEEALAFARTRKYDSDIARGKRQEEVLKAIIRKGLSIKSVTKFDNVLREIGDNLTTNMSFDAMTAFHDYAYRGLENDIETLTLKGDNKTIRGVFYYLLNDESVNEVSQQLKEHLELGQQEEVEEAVEDTET